MLEQDGHHYMTCIKVSTINPAFTLIQHVNVSLCTEVFPVGKKQRNGQTHIREFLLSRAVTLACLVSYGS